MTSPLFLGVDGGGTHTGFALVDADGRLVAAHRAAGTYHVEIGLDGLRNVLGEGLAAVMKLANSSPERVTHAFFGLPGYGEDSGVEPLLDALPQELLGHARYDCGNDMVCAWTGSLAAADGINIVAGTGSIAYGERQGRCARAGGWGELFGDEGSAYWVAVQGLNCFTRMCDGRLAKGPLYRAVRAALGLTFDLDLCGKLLSGHTRASIAALSHVVADAAREGDPCALRIFAEAGTELAAIVDAVRHALHYDPGESVVVSYSGGVFNSGPLVLESLRCELAKRSHKYRLEPPILSPSLGAAIHAAKLAGQPLSAAGIDRLAAEGRRAEHG